MQEEQEGFNPGTQSGEGEGEGEGGRVDEGEGDEYAALLQWLDSSECSYSGIRDRLLLGHHAMRVAAGLPTFATFASAAVKGKGESSAKAKLREAHRALEEMQGHLQGAHEQLQGAHEQLAEERRESQVEKARHEAALQIALQTERERLSEDRAKMAAQQAEILTRLADVAEARGRLEAREAEARSRADAREAEARARAEAREADAHARLEAKLSGIHSEEVRRLRAELERLKGTNHVKGLEGEATVSAALREAFDSWTFVDTSARGGESDFHLVSPAGETLVVEVKNKITVTGGDVSKSQRDVAELKERLGEGFLGYLFVSLRSRSIPGKGALHLEAPSSQSVPILWCGLEDAGGEVSRDIVRAARLLIDFGRVLASRRPPPPPTFSPSQEANAVEKADAEQRKKMEADLEKTMGKLNAHLEQLDEMRKIAARVSESASVTRRHAVAMQSAVDASFMSLDSYRVEMGAFRSPPEGGPPEGGPPEEGPPEGVGAASAVIECQKCGKKCASKIGLSNHHRFCKTVKTH